MQAAARQAAIKGENNLGINPNNPSQRLPNVPNGLGVGGLQVADGVPIDLAHPQSGEDPSLWKGAKLPTQKQENGKTTVTVEQLVQQALLNWKTFNVGKDTKLKFDQSRGGKDAGKWVAFNKVNDPSGVPSQILGSIEAQGQVYVINQNGIIFGGSSQVNVHTLVASTLPINDNLVQLGLLNNVDKQFLFSSLPIAKPDGGTMDPFTPPAANTPDGKPGDVIVQKGAKLSAPTSADHVGGRIALVGANVKNEGTISTPDGQTILAAGQQVAFQAHASNDATLRGLDVLVGAAEAGTGTAVNNGFINAPRANVTIAGKNVLQLGVIESSTSVGLNGRVDLDASYGATVTQLSPGVLAIAPSLSGLLTLGPNSQIRILPEWFSDETVVGIELALRSQINLRGEVIHLGTNSDILAPNALISLDAGTWRPFNNSFKLIHDRGQIYFDPGAAINVAGSTDIAASITQNILALELRGSELADSPLQRTGVLRGTTLYLDIRKTGSYNGFSWVGTPLGDASGFLGLVQRNVGQLTTAGGTVSLAAGGSVVMQPGSLIDVSGGWVNYDGGMVQTSRVTSGGQLLDISSATPDRLYDGIYTGKFRQSSAKWQVTETFLHPLALLGEHYETAYTQGANGGSISIVAPSMALDGDLRGNTVDGPRQRAAEPAPSALSLLFQAQDPTRTGFPQYSPTPPAVVFASTSNAALVAEFALDANGHALPLSSERTSTLTLSPELTNSFGFGNLSINNGAGTILVPEGITLATGVGGSISLAAANVTVEGNLIAPGGSLTLKAFNISPFLVEDLKSSNTGAQLPAVNPGKGIFTLAPGALLSTAGLVVDDRPGALDQATLPLTLNGGSITINSYSANLSEGSQIDASGGVYASPTGKITYGKGGSISISAGQDPNLKGITGGELILDATLSAYSGSQPGSLSLLAPQIQIGGVTSNPNTLLLTPEFFNRGGFGSFALTGLGSAIGQTGEFTPGILIASDTVLQPVVKNWLAQLNDPENGGLALLPYVRPDGLRTSVQLSFSTPGVRDDFSSAIIARGDFVLGENARIVTGPQGTVQITGDTAAIFGSIRAPGGSISITGASSFPQNSPASQPRTTVYIAPTAVISAAGTLLLTPDVRGYNTGTVLPGGSISISGNLVAAKGSLIDVSGATGVLDVRPSALGLNPLLDPMGEGQSLVIPTSSGLTQPLYNYGLVVSTRIDSDGGSITLKGGQQLFTDATLLGAAGGRNALGGSLTISSGRFAPAGVELTPLDPNLVINQSGDTIPSNFTGNAIGRTVLDGNGAAVPGRGYFAVDHFLNGGFDSLTLKGTVQFSGPVTIDARRRLSIADGGVIIADSDVNLSAPYVVLGTPFLEPRLATQPTIPYQLPSGPFTFSPTYGPGVLTVRGNLIDIGNLSLQNIGRLNLIAEGGDVRGDGSLDVAGDLYVRAGQVYPPTAVTFTISVADRNVLVAKSISGSTAVTLASAVLPPGFGVGSPLLGSTVTAINGTTVTLAAGASRSISSQTAVTFAPDSGTATFVASGDRALPYSAAGTLNVYASTINQDGVLRAPMGTINLGWDGTGTAPTGAVTGVAVANTEKLTLGSNSITSVSMIDPLNGQELTIPYGLVLNGISWIDPSGLDITAGNGPQKKITISASSIADQKGSVVDLRGGGELYAYRWAKGLGGSKDILASSGSFAIVPGYQADYSPYAPYNPTSAATNLGGDAGYVNGTLSVGDRIYLNGTDTLAAGYYTLLPARYALLPGAYLVTPKSGQSIGSFAMLDGSWLVSGYRYNSLNTSRQGQPLTARFEVVSSSDVRDRADYQDYLANATLRQGAISLGQPVPRLPEDAGQLVLQATQALTLGGRVLAGASTGGRGGLVDISSPVDILVAGPGVSGAPGQLVLDSRELSNFGAESLLIGGTRQVGTGGTVVTVKTTNITVNNAGAALQGPEIILAANQTLTLADGAIVQQKGSLAAGAETLLLGKSTTPGSGDGVLLRVSADPTAQISRTGLNNSTTSSMVIGPNATVKGAGVILDSTFATTLDPTASIIGKSISLNSGRISLQLDNPGALQPGTSLVLVGDVLTGLQSAQTLSLLSYTSIDIYGTGSFGTEGNLTLSAAQIRGFNNGGGTVTLSAKNINLENRADADPTLPVGAASGKLAFEAETIRLGVNDLRIDQFSDVALNASRGILGQGKGSLAVQGSLTATAPVFTASRQAEQAITAGGALTLLGVANSSSTLKGGLGATLTLKGATVTASSDIILPSGKLTLQATAGDVVVNGRLDAGGTAQNFYDLVRYTDAGQINLYADAGAVTIGTGAVVNVAAAAEGGDAGSLSIRSVGGQFTLAGTVSGQAGQGGQGGSFSLDTISLPTFGTLGSALSTGGFTTAQNVRVRTGDVLVDGTVQTRAFNLSADQGGILVTGVIDASGTRGGSIALAAGGSVTLANGSRLTVAATDFDNAGKGGSVVLETRGLNGGSVDLQTGSTIDLQVANNTATSASRGKFTGTLHLRAPQINGNTDLAVSAINGSILGASKILVEGYQVFDLTNTGGAITNTGAINAAGGTIASGTNVQGSVKANGELFLGTSGTTSANYTAMFNRLLANNAGLASSFILAPGAEVINSTGNLTLGATNSNSGSDWNLAGNRFGPKGAAGVLTLRAAGDVVLYNAISDGFQTSAYNSVLLARNQMLAANAQAYSYRIVAGADFSAANVRQISLASTGSIKLGKDGGTNIAPNFPNGAGTTAAAVGNRFQVIRTGSGDIDIAAAGDVLLLNQFASIYTAGTLVDDPTMGGTFDLPAISFSGPVPTNLGNVQQSPAYPAQYTLGGGSITIAAQGDIKHMTVINGQLVADSVREMPTNWLYRRGYVGSDGTFGATRFNDIGSTTWWVDFSNFFEGVGALGGGNITMTAGGNVANVDAVIPTNARMPKGKPDASKLVELGGGDLVVRAGHDIDAGVYYVERGQGTLSAGGSIHTNATRTPSNGVLENQAALPSETWLPTTLFVGKGNFDISAQGDVLLGPTVNAFLLPQSYNNSFWYKTYFSTYGATSGVSVTSLGGDVTLRNVASLPEEDSVGSGVSLLKLWYDNVLRFDRTKPSAAYYQPWLRLNETAVQPFNTAFSLAPGSLRATAFSGAVNVVGGMTLAPSPTGTLDLLAATAVNGLQINGETIYFGNKTKLWGSSRINVSDANPDNLYGVASPFAYQTVVGLDLNTSRETGSDFLNNLDALFAESGATNQTLQTKQALHASGVLHTGDVDPVHIYALDGDISGFTLFSPKATKVIAGRDISDISFYIQNVADDDISIIASGRDIIAYNDNSPLRVTARSLGNVLNTNDTALAGDLQISGPGTLEVLAGRNLDLGIGPNSTDGTNLGLVSIGNARNPYLLFDGASIVAGAGIGPSSGLDQSKLDFDAFFAEVIDSSSGSARTDYVNVIADALGISGAGEDQVLQKFEALSSQQKAPILMNVFYLVLRNAARGTTDATADAGTAGGSGSTGVSSDSSRYDAGFAAIDALFPGTYQGDISLTAREIKTRNGGDIAIFAPGGKLTVGFDVAGAQPLDQGILTESGGNISIFTHDDVIVGTSRIFTLRGGNEIIWSSEGDIAAGSSAKTVQSAPPTRVLIDPQSADVQTDLAGLATGGGIGVLATVAGVPPGDVDLIAPNGAVDAGDAGIRVSGNLNIAATQVLNASNIATGGASSGVPSAAPSAAAPAVVAPSSSTAATGNAAAEQAASQRKEDAASTEELPSLVTVEVIGYGGGDGPASDSGTNAAPDNSTTAPAPASDDEEEKRRRKQQEESAAPPPQ